MSEGVTKTAMSLEQSAASNAQEQSCLSMMTIRTLVIPSTHLRFFNQSHCVSMTSRLTFQFFRMNFTDFFSSIDLASRIIQLSCAIYELRNPTILPVLQFHIGIILSLLARHAHTTLGSDTVGSAK